MPFYLCNVGDVDKEYAYAYDTTYRSGAYNRFTVIGISDGITYNSSTYQFTANKSFKARIMLHCYNTSSHSTTKCYLNFHVNGVSVYQTDSFGGGSYISPVIEYTFASGDTFGVHQDGGGVAYCRFLAVREI